MPQHLNKCPGTFAEPCNTMVWQGVKLQLSYVNSLADELTTALSTVPSNPQCVKLPCIDYKVAYPGMRPKESVEFKEVSRDLAPFHEMQ